MHETDVEAAARIWARAVGRRDGVQPATTATARTGIERRLALDGATLLVDRQDGHAVGFALLAPRTGNVELFYLAVDPDAWGLGVASRLLRRIDERARDLGHDRLELWVIEDNERAIKTYERAGWVPTADLQQDPPGSSVERRFVRTVGPPAR